MKDIIITEDNKEFYKKLVAIKEGKMVPSSKCVLLPFLLLGIQTFVFATIFLYKPFLDVYFNFPSMLVTPTEMLLFGIVFYTSVKLDISLSKKMSLNQLKKENPDFDTRVSVKEVKQKLKEYRKNNVPIYSVKKINKPINDDINFNEKIEFLENEKEFLKKYQKSLDDDIAKQKKLKY